MFVKKHHPCGSPAWWTAGELLSPQGLRGSQFLFALRILEMMVHMPKGQLLNPHRGATIELLLEVSVPGDVVRLS